MEDPYRTLGLAADASRAEIKAAFRRCALEFHPDRHSRSPAPVRDWALSRFKQASDAYELLLDDSRRAAYDRRLGYGRFHRSRGFGNGYGGGRGGGGVRTWSASGGGKGVEWEAVFRYLTSRRFALNLLLASALLGGTLVIEKGGEAMWNLNNSGVAKRLYIVCINRISLHDWRDKMNRRLSEDHHLNWIQWQLLDSFLPTGGFAHSYGLEAAIQNHIVCDTGDLKKHVIQVLDNTGSLLLPFVYGANVSPDTGTWSKLDQWLEATLTNEVSRKASVSQGSALLRVAASVFVEVPTLKQLRESSLASGTFFFHHAPIFGLVCGLLGLDSGFSQRAYMFTTMRDVLSSATRLNLVGPLGASALQHQVAPIAEDMVKKWMDRPIEESCQTSVLLDVVQGCHSYLFSRLFCS